MHRCVFMDVWVDLGMYTIAMLFLIWVVLSILVHKSMIKWVSFICRKSNISAECSEFQHLWQENLCGFREKVQEMLELNWFGKLNETMYTQGSET